MSFGKRSLPGVWNPPSWCHRNGRLRVQRINRKRRLAGNLLQMLVCFMGQWLWLTASGWGLQGNSSLILGYILFLFSLEHSENPDFLYHSKQHYYANIHTCRLNLLQDDYLTGPARRLFRCCSADTKAVYCCASVQHCTSFCKTKLLLNLLHLFILISRVQAHMENFVRHTSGD